MKVELLEKLLLEQQNTIESMRKDSQKHIEEIRSLNQTICNLQEQIGLLTSKLFGASSEKQAKHLEGQLSLFGQEAVNEIEYLAEDEVTELVSDEKKTSKRKAKRTKEEQFKNLPIFEIFVDSEEEEPFCDYCNTSMVEVGKKLIREEIRIIPAKMKRIRYMRKTYLCPTCKEDGDTYFKKSTSGAPAPLLPGTSASASIVSYVMHQKYVNALPLYRQEKDFATMGAPIRRATLATWVNTCSMTYLKQLYDYMHEELLKREVLMSDETTCQVLKEEGKNATSKSYMWIHRTGNDGLPSIILYDYQPTRSGDHAVRFLGSFAGYHHCDGFSGYNKLKNVTRCACLAHIRRYFFDAVPKRKGDSKTLTVAEYGVAYCNALFKLEREFEKDTPEGRKEKRLEKEKPILDAFLCWLNKQDPPKGSKLYKAVNYALNQWDYMNNYLLDGRCSISNNLTENSVRPYTLIRKNSLFHDTPKGATASAIICSIIETAKASQLNVHKYLEYLLLTMPDYEESAGLEKLMPWSDDIQEKFKNMK